MSYAVRTKGGKVVRRFATRGEAEGYMNRVAHSPSSPVYGPPFRIVAIQGDDLRNMRHTVLPDEYRTRQEAERAASEASRRDHFSYAYQVEGKSKSLSRLGHRSEGMWWVTIYKDGWLKDAQTRNSYQPSDQRLKTAILEPKLPKFVRRATRANDSPLRNRR